MSKILIVDDDPDVTLAARLALENEGYEVVEARTGSEGLQKVKQEHPDLIILDVMMDTPTAGFQTALTLRNPEPDSEYAAYRNIPIMMLTSIHRTTSLRFSTDEEYLPVDTFMDKPIDPPGFVSKVKELLAKE